MTSEEREEAIAILQTMEYELSNQVVSTYCRKKYDAIKTAIKALKQEPIWIPTSERLPNKNQWALVTTEDYPKLFEIMCYQGIRIGRHDIGNGWEEYEYPSWTSGHGDIQGSHPKAWMPLPKSYREVEE